MQWSLKKQNWLQTKPKCQNEQTKPGGKHKKEGPKIVDKQAEKGER